MASALYGSTLRRRDAHLWGHGGRALISPLLDLVLFALMPIFDAFDQ